MAFGLEQYAKIAAVMRSLSGKAVVSVNDIPEMREAFSGLPMQTITTRHTVGRTDRAVRAELLIKNSP